MALVGSPSRLLQASSIKRVFQLPLFRTAAQPHLTLYIRSQLELKAPPTLHLHRAAQLTRIIINAVHAVSNALQLPVYFFVCKQVTLTRMLGIVASLWSLVEGLTNFQGKKYL